LNEIIELNISEIAMAYVRDCIGISVRRDTDISFNVAPSLAKINAWLNSKEHSNQIESCILKVGAELTK
jgi:hypothetical protein